MIRCRHCPAISIFLPFLVLASNVLPGWCDEDRYFIGGCVAKPGFYTLSSAAYLTVSDAIFRAGGLTSEHGKTASRTEPSPIKVFEFRLDDTSKQVVSPQDVIYVYADKLFVGKGKGDFPPPRSCKG